MPIDYYYIYYGYYYIGYYYVGNIDLIAAAPKEEPTPNAIPVAIELPKEGFYIETWGYY